MEIYQLRAFIAVARTGNLTRASEQLHLTQSAVSRQIKALEDELGVVLFERCPVGMDLTSAARRLLPFATRTVDNATELMSAAHSLQGEVCGELRLGSIIDPESIRLGSLLSTLLRFHPQIDVRLHHGISGSILERVKANELDAGFFLGFISEPDIASLQVCMENYVVAGPREWQSQIEDADWASLAAMPWVATPPGSSQTRVIARTFGARGLVLRTVVEADQEASMIELVRSGMALCLMRERLARQAIQSGQIAVWRGARIPCPLLLVYPRATAERPLMRALLSAARQVWSDGDDESAAVSGQAGSSSSDGSGAAGTR